MKTPKAEKNKLITDLNNTDLEAVSETLSDPQMRMLLKLLPKLSESLSGMAALADDLNDVIPIYQSLAKDMEDPEIQKSIDNLPQTLTQLQHIVSVLENNKELLENLGTLASGDKAAQIEVIMDTAEKYIGSVNLSQDQTQVLAERMKAWLNFGNEYTIFTEKTAQMTSSVLFTYKTDAIEKPETTADITAAPEETEDNKFVAWVKGLFS